MYNCCMPNFQDCASCYDGCFKKHRACDSAEFPKCCGIYTEEKFSKMNPNMFLSVPKSRSRGASRSSASKKNKTKKKFVSKSDSKCDGENDDENAADCPKNGGNATAVCMPNMGMMPGMCEFPPNNETADICQSGIITTSVNEFEAVLPTNPTPGVDYGPSSQLPCVNQAHQQLMEMPAAGLPSEKCPRFDPCTGLECPEPTKRWPPLECKQMEKCKSSSSDFTDRLRRVCPQAKECRKNSKPGYQLVNCNNVCPDLIERLCGPQTGKPDNCYILLPVAMSNHSKKENDSPKARKANSSPSLSKKKADVEASKNEGQSTRSAGSKSSSLSKAEKPTRNCGCNTVISGSTEDTNIDGQMTPLNNDSNGGAPVCQPGCCHCPGSMAYYYNPYYGCYCWYKKCCCHGYNGCTNYCNSYCNSCPMPAKSTNKNGNSQAKQAVSSKKQRSTNGSQISKKSVPESDSRITAGAVTPFEPNVQEMYEQWSESQRFAKRLPKTAPTRHPSPVPLSSAFHHSAQPGFVFYPYHYQQMQMSNNHVIPPCADQTPPKSQTIDIDWTPH